MKKIIATILTILNLDADTLGSLLFHGNCVTCHFETKAVSAPSMMQVRQKYLDVFSDKKEFVKYMSNWVANPKEETSIYLDAVKKYKLMPQLGYEREVIEDIASYIYDTDFTKKIK